MALLFFFTKQTFRQFRMQQWRAPFEWCLHFYFSTQQKKWNGREPFLLSYTLICSRVKKKNCLQHASSGVWKQNVPNDTYFDSYTGLCKLYHKGSIELPRQTLANEFLEVERCLDSERLAWLGDFFRNEERRQCRTTHIISPTSPCRLCNTGAKNFWHNFQHGREEIKYERQFHIKKGVFLFTSTVKQLQIGLEREKC